MDCMVSSGIVAGFSRGRHVVIVWLPRNPDRPGDRIRLMQQAFSSQ